MGALFITIACVVMAAVCALGHRFLYRPVDERYTLIDVQRETQALLRPHTFTTGLYEAFRYRKARGSRLLKEGFYPPCVVCNEPYRTDAQHRRFVHIGRFNLHRACVPAVLDPFLFRLYRTLWLAHLLPTELLGVVTLFVRRLCYTGLRVRHDALPRVQLDAAIVEQANARKPGRARNPPRRG